MSTTGTTSALTRTAYYALRNLRLHGGPTTQPDEWRVHPEDVAQHFAAEARPPGAMLLFGVTLVADDTCAPGTLTAVVEHVETRAEHDEHGGTFTRRITIRADYVVPIGGRP